MTIRNKVSILTGVALAAVLTPAIASAQAAGDDRNVGVRERVKPEYEPLGIRAGAFMIRPEILGEVEYNDNVFATNTGKADDFIFRVTPSVDARSDWSRNELGVAASLTRWEFNDFSSENRTDWNVLGNGRLDLGTRTAIRGSAGYSKTSEPRTDGSSPQNAQEPVQLRSPTYSVGATQEFNRLRIAADATYKKYNYKDTTQQVTILGVPTIIPLDQDVRDYEAVEYVGRADYALPKGGVVFIEGGYNTRKYDQTTPQDVDNNPGTIETPLNQDSDGWRALIGTRIDLTNLLRGEAAVGYLSQNYDDPRLKTAKGIAARVDMQWFVTGITTIGFGGSRNVQESGVFGGGGVQGGGVIASSAYARVDHELLRNVILSGDVAYRDFDYKTFDRNDNVFEAGLGAEYLMNRVLSFGLNYRYYDRTSDGTAAGTDFSINRVMLSITARL